MIAQADARHIPLADESVHMCVTSPPFWNLRDYGLGDRGIGLERTPAEYVANIVAAFREVWRVLRPDGTLWLNLGSAYSSGGPSLAEALGGLLEKALVVFVDGLPVASPAESVDVSPLNQGLPKGKLGRLLASQGEGSEDGSENLGQVLNLLAHPGNRGAGSAPGGVEMDAPYAEVTMHKLKHGLVVRADGNPKTQAELRVLGSPGAGAGEHDERPLPVSEADEPRVERCILWHTGWHSFAANALAESIPDVNVMDQPIPFRDGLGAFACPLRDFSVAEAGKKHLSLIAVRLGVGLSISSVGHCSFLMSDGSIIPYSTLLAQAEKRVRSLSAKQDLMMPARVAMALQEDGWILRSPIIWHKPNPMPESVRDRPTKSHEHLFLLAKQPHYFYDAEAIKEPISPKTLTVHTTPRKGNGTESTGEKLNKWMEEHGGRQHPAARNRRDVWTISTAPFKGAHFAVFPPALVEPCILAGTSAKGVCSECGAPWQRIVEKQETGRTQKMADGWDTGNGGHGTIHRDGREAGETGKPVMATKTTGWRPTCDHDAEPVPAIVLDCFAGSGTVGKVCRLHGRRFVGLDLSMKYLRELALPRAEGTQAAGANEDLPLFGAEACTSP